MTQFDKWCTAVTTPVGDWKLEVLTANPGQIDYAVKAISEAIPAQYTSEDRLAFKSSNHNGVCLGVSNNF